MTEPRLIDLREKWNQSLFDGFVNIYRSEFTIGDISEDPQDWVERLKSIKKIEGEPVTHLLVAVKPQDQADTQTTTVTGGVVFEYYPESAVCLLTYLVVSKDHRKQGLAKSLIQKATEIAQFDAKKDGKSLALVLAETLSPLSDAKNSSPEEAFQTSVVLRHLGTKRICIPYVQPALHAGKQRCRELLLLYFPDFVTSDDNTSMSESLRDFLTEFYLALGVENVENDPDFQNMIKKLPPHDGLQIAELPTLESSILTFSPAAFTLHFVCAYEQSMRDGISSEAIKKLELEAVEDSEEFRSFVNDLLTHRFRKAKRLISRCHGSAQALTIHFPNEYEYRSEGRREMVKCLEPRLHVVSRLSYTIFPTDDLNVLIWHLSLVPAVGFTEYDIIKLSQLYDWEQESTTLHEEIQFSWNGHGEADLATCLTELFKIDEGIRGRLAGGTINLDHKGVIQAIGTGDLFEKLYAAHKGNDESRSDLIAMYLDNQKSEDVLKAFSGAVTGVLDFKRMDEFEMLDSLEPTCSEKTGFTRIHRATYFDIQDEDPVLELSVNTIGNSPYSIIVHSILLYNDAILDYLNKKLEEMKVRRTSLGERVRTLNWARRLLDVHFLPNILHYQTERTIYEQAMSKRGLNEEIAVTRSRLDAIKNDADVEKDRRSSRAGLFWSILLLAISLISTRSIVFEYLEAQAQGFPGATLLYWKIWLWGSLGVGAIWVIIFIFLRRRR